MYVIDDNDSVLVLTPEGQCVKVIGEKGREPGQFNTPRGVAINRNGVLFIVIFKITVFRCLASCNFILQVASLILLV